VLEQLRLLSNLETTKAKLLQIILVGQPEFGEKLDSFELRQLEQRITLNCHLNPLTLKETGEYISHRIQIASHKNKNLFTKDAIKAIFRYSGGVPRMINIVCDRALLCAFSRDVKTINRNIALLAIRELSGKRAPRIGFFVLNRKPLFLLAALVIVLGTLIVYPHVDLKESNAGPKQTATVVHKILVPQAGEMPEEGPPDASVSLLPDDARNPAAIKSGTETMDTDPTEEKPVVSIGSENLNTLLQETDAKQSRNTAMKIILDLWQAEAGLKEFLQNIENHQEYFLLAAKQNHLSAQKISGNLSLVNNLNHAAILELYIGNDPMPRYLTLVELANDDLIFEVEDMRIQVAANDLLPFWKNRFYVIWKNIYGYTKEVQIEKNGNAVLILKRHLQEIGYCDIVLNSLYDNSVKDAVKDVQKKYDLEIDGIVGPLTEIALYNENKSLVIPRLRKVL
jgi:general secretion pathway protein A